MYPFGAIVLARFPFTALSGDKLRPALVVSKQPSGGDVIPCFITSVPRTGRAIALIQPDRGNGLKLPSAVRFDKIATLNAQIIVGSIGHASQAWLAAHAAQFRNVFGFAMAVGHGPAPNAG